MRVLDSNIGLCIMVEGDVVMDITRLTPLLSLAQAPLSPPIVIGIIPLTPYDAVCINMHLRTQA